MHHNDKQPKLVISLQGSTPSDFITKLNSLKELSSEIIAEIRFDYLDRQFLNISSLKTIRVTTNRALIFTLRKKDEGGYTSISTKKRLKLIKAAITNGFEYIDIEYSSTKQLIATILATTGNFKTILSYHNFDQTNWLDVENHYLQMRMLQPNIIKIVTLAQNQRDNEIPLRLLKKYQKDPILKTCFCMGSKGKISRLKGYDTENYLTYLALDKDNQCAPAQLTLQEFMISRGEMNAILRSDW